jgi:hypothetical protein
MTFYYTARGAYDKDYDENAWQKYIDWSKLTHLKELVSVDSTLNELLVEPDRDNEEDWRCIVIDDYYETGFFTPLDYVLRKIKSREKFNLLAVVINPIEHCNDVKLENFEFLGYDLLDREYGNSALSNCGGFDETFLASDLNHFGLIEDYEKAFDIRRRLLENNPDEHHADTNVIAIWRHNTIGKPNR